MPINKTILINTLLPSTSRVPKTELLRELFLELFDEVRELDEVRAINVGLRREILDLRADYQSRCARSETLQRELDTVPWQFHNGTQGDIWVSHLPAEWMKTHKIQAIKVLRECTSIGLREAKEKVEAYIESQTPLVLEAPKYQLLGALIDPTSGGLYFPCKPKQSSL